MKRLLCLLALLALPLSAQTVFRFNGQCTLDVADVTTAPSATILVANGCTVSVFDTGTANLSTLCSDDLITCTPLSNPFTAAATGRFSFYVVPGNYDIQLTGGVPSIGTVTIADVPVGTSGTVTVTTTEPLLTTQFDFTAQSPTQTLTGTITATVTLTPCPLGVGGADTNHYLRITDTGAGPDETVLITGGTCTSGAASGTIQFTPASNHVSGQWSIGPGNCGITEAINDAVDGQTVLLSGDCTAYAGFEVVDKFVQVKGFSRSTKISFDSTTPNTGVLLKMTSGTSPDRGRIGLSSLVIVSTSTTQKLIEVNGINAAPDLVADVVTDGGTIGLDVIGCNGSQFRNLEIRNPVSPGGTAIHFDMDTGNGNNFFRDITIVRNIAGDASYGWHSETDQVVDCCTVFINNLQIFGNFLTAVSIENTSGTPGTIWHFIQHLNIDGNYDTDGIRIANVKEINISDSHCINTNVTSTTPCVSIDNVNTMTWNNFRSQSAGRGAFELINAPSNIQISGVRMAGGTAFWVDTVSPPTNLVLHNNIIFPSATLTNDLPALRGAMLQTIASPLKHFVGSTAATSALIEGDGSGSTREVLELSNLDGSAAFILDNESVVNRWRVLGSNSFQIDNTNNTGVELIVNGDGDVVVQDELTVGSVVLSAIPAATNGSMIYCSDCLKGSDPCTSSSTGAMAMRVNAAWQCF